MNKFLNWLLESRSHHGSREWHIAFVSSAEVPGIGIVERDYVARRQLPDGTWEYRWTDEDLERLCLDVWG